MFNNGGSYALLPNDFDKAAQLLFLGMLVLILLSIVEIAMRICIADQKQIYWRTPVSIHTYVVCSPCHFPLARVQDCVFKHTKKKFEKLDDLLACIVYFVP